MPEYLHPSVHSRIIDNSFVFQTAEGSTVLFACGKATKGPDNKLVRLTSVGEAKFYFGEPDMSETGQTLYNVFEHLKAGGEAYFIRILPEDGLYANAMLSVACGQDGLTNIVKPTLTTVPGATSVAAMQTLLGADPVTDATFVSYPLGVLMPVGRGKAYEDLGFRISLLDSLDGTYDFRTYTFEIAAKNTVGVDTIIDGPYTVSFEPTAKDRNRESMYWANVVNKYSTTFRVLDRKDLIDTIREFINPTDTVNPLHLDIFFGAERNGVSVAQGIHQAVKFATPLTAGLADNQVTDDTAADLKTVNHISGGSEGTWTGGNSEDSLLIKAYTGQLDSNATDKKQYLFDLMLDGNNSAAVKNAMSQMATDIRGDCVALLDCGFQANEQQTVDFRTNSIGMSSFATAIFAQDFVVYDEYTGQNVKVTTPYFLAKKIAPHDDKFGVHWSFAGPRRGVISGYEAINFFPNEAWKETLYKKQINYIEKDPKRVNLGTQLTSQTVNSALSNLNNVRALFRIKRDVEQLVDEYRDEFNDDITHEAMSYNLNSYLKKWVSNRACSTIKATVYASDYDKQQKIVRVQVELTFNGLIERIFADFIINR
jgi:hypothetical protein